MEETMTEEQLKRMYEVLLKRFTVDEANEAVTYIVGAKGENSITESEEKGSQPTSKKD